MSDPCPICGGTGFELRTGEGGVSTATRCACSYRERGAQLVRAARIPRRYEHCRFDSFSVYDPALQPPLDTAREWFERWPDRVEHGLLFWGSPGTGKSHLAVAIIRELAERKGARVLFVEQRELLKELQATFDGAAGRSESEVLAPIVDAEVLLLDDLGAGRTSAWAQDVMHDVLAHRYNRRLPTLMTTNRATGDDESAAADAPSLRDRLGDALMSRLYEMCLLVGVAAKTDYRRSMLHAQHRF
jgi:DNA replication protein DnaC